MSRTDTAIDTLVAAFFDDPLYRWLFADPTQRATALRDNFRLVLTLADERAHRDEDQRGHAVAVWTDPGRVLMDDPTAFVELLGRHAPNGIEAALSGMTACSARPRHRQRHRGLVSD